MNANLLGGARGYVLIPKNSKNIGKNVSKVRIIMDRTAIIIFDIN